MLNKLKVIALLLLVSLLSGCKGTTGSGTSEVSMQSKAPSTNTTSIPTAEAGNLPPIAGYAVRVASWSPNPNGVSMTARKVGKLAIVNNCLVMRNKGAPPTLLIFPYRSGVWDSTKRTFTFEGKVIRIGETIEVGGGRILNLDSFLKRTGKYNVPNCGLTDSFVVS